MYDRYIVVKLIVIAHYLPHILIDINIHPSVTSASSYSTRQYPRQYHRHAKSTPPATRQASLSSYFEPLTESGAFN